MADHAQQADVIFDVAKVLAAVVRKRLIDSVHLEFRKFARSPAPFALVATIDHEAFLELLFLVGIALRALVRPAEDLSPSADVVTVVDSDVLDCSVDRGLELQGFRIQLRRVFGRRILLGARLLHLSAFGLRGRVKALSKGIQVFIKKMPVHGQGECS